MQTNPTPKPEPKNFFLAEDDPDDQKLFLEFIQDRTDVALTQVAENGIELLEMLSQIQHKNDLPDFIVLDQNMPMKNGLKTLEELKQNERFAQIPVMIYSTYADEKLVEKSYQLGAASVVMKPHSKKGYDSMIATFLTKLA